MPSIADTVARVAAAGVPVLFLDTCSVLDVIRAPVRSLSDVVEATTNLLAMTTATAPQCNLVVGSLVPGEWQTHDKTVVEELTRHLNRLDSQAGHIHDLCRHLGISLGFGPSQYETSGIVTRLHDLSRDLLRSALVIDAQQQTQDRAFHRVVFDKRRPCRKGGELKDCVVFEECLEVCRQLQAISFPRKLVFCSSNTGDYCDPGETPHPDVAADCAAVGMVFTTTLRWAVSELKS